MPVAFALIAGVLVGTAFTPVSLPPMMAQLFNGTDSEALLAIPFLLPVGELMTSANVAPRRADLSCNPVCEVSRPTGRCGFHRIRG